MLGIRLNIVCVNTDYVDDEKYLPYPSSAASCRELRARDPMTGEQP